MVQGLHQNRLDVKRLDIVLLCVKYLDIKVVLGYSSIPSDGKSRERQVGT